MFFIEVVADSSFKTSPSFWRAVLLPPWEWNNFCSNLSSFVSIFPISLFCLLKPSSLDFWKFLSISVSSVLSLTSLDTLELASSSFTSLGSLEPLGSLELASNSLTSLGFLDILELISVEDVSSSWKSLKSFKSKLVLTSASLIESNFKSPFPISLLCSLN